jgi:hypothetical protein
VPFVALSTPAAPTGTVSGGLTGSTFTITYRITANSTVGESVASTSLSKTVSTDRDMWDPSTQTITLNWTAVTSAVSYNVYMGIGGVGTEFLIATSIMAAQSKTIPTPTHSSTLRPVRRLHAVTLSTATYGYLVLLATFTVSLRVVPTHTHWTLHRPMVVTPFL